MCATSSQHPIGRPFAIAEFLSCFNRTPASIHRSLILKLQQREHGHNEIKLVFFLYGLDPLFN